MVNLKDDLDLRAKRYGDNSAILFELTAYLQKNPDVRFNQALLNLNIIQNESDIGVDNDYYAEPGEILERMKK